MSRQTSQLHLLEPGLRAALERGRVVDSAGGARLVSYAVGADERYGRRGHQCWAVLGPGGGVRLLDDEAAARRELQAQATS